MALALPERVTSGRLWVTGDNNPKRSQFRPGRLFRSSSPAGSAVGAGPGSGRQWRYRSLVLSPRLSPRLSPSCCPHGCPHPGVTAMGDRAPGGSWQAWSRARQLLHLGKVGSTQGCSQRGTEGYFGVTPCQAPPWLSLGLYGCWRVAQCPSQSGEGSPSPPQG